MIDLKSYIVESTVESTARLEKIAKQAIDELADVAMENIYWEFLKNASDFNRCKDSDITYMIDLVADDERLLDKWENEEFSIKDVLKKYKYNVVDAIEQFVEENWEDYLDEDVVESLNDFFDVGGIVNKRALCGGRYEAFRDFQMKISAAVVEKIKKTLK